MKNLLFLFYFILAFGYKSSAQEKYILDSLNNTIDSTSSEFVKIKNLIELSTYYWYIDTDSSINFVKSAIKIINNHKNDDEYQQQLSDTENSLGVNNYIKGNYSLALKHFEKSKNISLKYNNLEGVASSQNNIGHIFSRLKEYDKALESYQYAFNYFKEKNQEITDSIQHAKRIQSAILPPDKIFKQHLPNSFILYKPKDIVAGDFYWLEKKDDDDIAKGIVKFLVDIYDHSQNSWVSNYFDYGQKIRSIKINLSHTD